MRFVVKETGHPDTPPIEYVEAHGYARVRELIHLSQGARRTVGPVQKSLWWDQQLILSDNSLVRLHIEPVRPANP